MRVALDGTPLTVPTGGIRRYTEELFRALRLCFPEDEYALVSDQLPGSRVGFVSQRWWSLGVQSEMRRLRSEVFHGTDFSVPYLPLRPSVMTIHDLSPWRPELAPAASRRIRRRTPLLIRLGVATMIVTPSEAVRNEAISKFSLAPERVVAIPLGAPPVHPAVPVRRERPYFLFVGTIEPRKNVAALIAAWRPLQNEANLVLIGRKREDAPALQNEPNLEWLGAVSDSDLPAWYAGAAACVYPSRYEGFGLPVLEAMGYGAPVITSEDPAITEVAGGAALQVDPSDIRAFTAAMRAVLDPNVASEWRDRGCRRAAEFSWERTARLTREVYLEAMRRFRG